MRFIKRHSLELQFWGYETGNVCAAIAGAGGFAALTQALRDTTLSNPHPLAALSFLFTQLPDAAATLSVMALVIFAFPVAALARRIGGASAAELVHVLALPLAFSLLLFGLFNAVNAFTLSASAFVMGSCLLRLGNLFPILIKLGGLFLALGGGTLSLAGLTLPVGGIAQTGLALTTFLVGFYAAGAGLLTYLGGNALIASQSWSEPGETVISRFLHPKTGGLARGLAFSFDRAVTLICERLVRPAVFWASQETKEKRPFYLAMVARLPWRVIAWRSPLPQGPDWVWPSHCPTYFGPWVTSPWGQSMRRKLNRSHRVLWSGNEIGLLISLQKEQRGQITVVDPNLGLCGDRWLGMKRDTRARACQHAKIVCAIAHRQHIRRGDPKPRGDRFQCLNLRLTAQNGLPHLSGKFPMGLNECVRPVLIKAKRRRHFFRKRSEAA